MKTDISNLIDLKKIDTLLEGFNKSTGFVTAILDLEGKILSKSGWRPMCTQFHRVNPETSKKCISSDTLLANKLEKGEKYHAYKCLNGLIDVAVPLKINGEHVANLFSGQFFFEEPDIAFFKKQAAEFGFDEIIYLDALSKVPVVSEEKVKTAMDFLLNMTEFISELALQKVKQEKVAQNLKDSEQKFKAIFEAANAGKSIILPSGEINVNEAYCKILGYTRQELKNKKWHELTPEEDIPTIQMILDRLAAGENDSVRFEKRYICKNGSHIWADESVSIQRNKNGEPLHFITTVIEITERKQAERLIEEKSEEIAAQNEEMAAQNEELNQTNKELIEAKNKAEVSEEKLKSIFRVAPVGIGVLYNRTFADVNPRVSEMTGYRIEELQGQSARILYPTQEEYDFVGQEKYKQIAKHGTGSVETRWKRKDSKIIDILLNSTPVDSSDLSKGVTFTALDITERRQAELVLQERNEEIAAQNEELNQANVELIEAKEKAERNEIELIKAQEIAHLGSWHLNIETNEVVWTEELYKMYGFDPALPPPPYTEHMKLFTPESWDILSSSLAKTREFGIPYELELKTIKSDQSNGWMWVRGEAVLDENKKIAELWGAAQDITERKHVEEALRKSQNNYQNLVENTPDIIYSMNTEGYFTFVSNNVSRYGFNPEEMIGHHIQEYIHPDDVEEVLSDLQKSFEQETPLKSVFRLASRESNTIWFEDTSRKLIENDQVTGFTGIIRDITKRKEAEEALLKSNQRLESLLDISRKITSTIDQNVIMQMVVENAIKLLGLDTGAIYLKTDDETINLSATTPALPDNFPGELRKAYLKNHPHLQKAMQTGKYVLMEDALTTKLTPDEKDIVEKRQLRTVLYQPIKIREMSHGVLILSSTETTRVFINDELEMLQAFANQAAHIIDNVQNYADLKKYTHELEKQIKQREKAEKELIVAKEKAEESDRLKSAFLANMSHEIRTPMNGILGFAELLNEPDLTGTEQQKCIDMIGKSGKRMLNIINDIIDISKIESGLMAADIKETMINEQAEYIYTFFKPEVEAKGIKFSFNNTLPQKEAIIKTDREKLYAILTNLVKNAIKYTKEGALEFGYHLKRYNEALELEFYVKDTGIGIPTDRQEAIFERFIQADIADKMAYQGAGLGLSISKAYVELLGGKIWVESEEGKGSTFYFTLPYNTETAAETIDQQHASIGSNDGIRKLKILIVEDDEVSEMLIVSFIKMFCKEILIARTGLEAVEVCRGNPDIDLILMDIRMPNMGGYEATKQIREFNKEVIIMAQTAYGLSGDKERAIKSGCNDYIPKPIIKTELLALIQKYFGK